MKLPRSLTVRAALVVGAGLLLEVVSRVLDRLDLVSDATGDVLRYAGQGAVAFALPVMVYGFRRALGVGEGQK